jgi:hypothetical protein
MSNVSNLVKTIQDIMRKDAGNRCQSASLVSGFATVDISPSRTQAQARAFWNLSHLYGKSGPPSCDLCSLRSLM